MNTVRKLWMVLLMLCMISAAGTAMAATPEDDILENVNMVRQAAGVRPLTKLDSLQNAAATRAAEASVFFSHQRPDGSLAKSALSLPCSWFGENLAISSTVDAERIVRAWMNSPTHRANLLNRHFTQMGLSRMKGQDGHYYWALELIGE